jgi:GTP-binding protein
MDEFTPEDLEQARILFARPATFIMGCAKIEQLPEPDLPEIAFAGRSNVGKSSLINGLVGMHKLARASNEPGSTREVNIYDLDGKKFQDLGRDYLRGRVTLKRVYLLIDARHGLKSVDKEALDALDLAAVSYQIVLTKADKLKKGEAEKVQAETLKAIAKRPAAFPAVIVTSAEKGDGMPELRAEIMRTTSVVL